MSLFKHLSTHARRQAHTYKSQVWWPDIEFQKSPLTWYRRKWKFYVSYKFSTFYIFIICFKIKSNIHTILAQHHNKYLKSAKCFLLINSVSVTEIGNLRPMRLEDLFPPQEVDLGEGGSLSYWHNTVRWLAWAA